MKVGYSTLAFLMFILVDVLLVPSFSLCGDRICTPDELGVCKDCAFVSRNFVCDSISPETMKAYDPDCKGGACYDIYHIYSNGRGSSCFPYICSNVYGGCTSSCSTSFDCSSLICSSGRCVFRCIDGASTIDEESCCGVLSSGICKGTTNSSLEVYPLSSSFWFSSPAYVHFIVYGNGTYLLNVSTICEVEYSKKIYVKGSSRVKVKIKRCPISGPLKVKLYVYGSNARAAATTYVLSYPTTLYTKKIGVEKPSKNILSFIGRVPVLFRIWWST